MTTPSTGKLSPGRTIKTSPTLSVLASTSMISPLRSIRAVLGCSLISSSIAAEVLLLARASINLPSSTSVMMAVLASK